MVGAVVAISLWLFLLHLVVLVGWLLTQSLDDLLDRHPEAVQPATTAQCRAAVLRVPELTGLSLRRRFVLVLALVLVFFFLKDSQLIAAWFRGYLPRERALISSGTGLTGDSTK